MIEGYVKEIKNECLKNNIEIVEDSAPVIQGYIIK
jgi:hypothetical protein